MTTYSHTSPYYSTTIKNGYLDILTYRPITAEVDDIEYEVTSKYENRPDLLASDLYGDPRLWWVFAMRNKDILRDPVYDLTAGIRIFLPKLPTLKTDLGI